MRRTDGRPDYPGEERPLAAGPTPFQWLQLVLGCLRRRRIAAAIAFVLCIGAWGAFFAYRQSRPLYRVEGKILAQRNQALPSAVRSVYEDLPTRSAWDIVHRRDNLIALVRHAKLLTETGAPLKKNARGLEENPVDEFVTLLDEALVVTVAEGTITFHIDWPDAQQAYDIIQGAIQNFLEARHVQEVTAIDEVLTVLTGQAAALRSELDAAAEEVRRNPDRPGRQAVTRVRRASEELARLQARVESKQRAIQDVEEFRRRRLADLQAQLDQARNTLSDAHPTVIGLRKDIEALSRSSPQMDTLREEERVARAEYAERAAREGVATEVVTVAPPPAATPEEDPRVRELRLQLEQMTLRIQSARIERDAARAAFKYRYNVIWPPQVPDEPVGANPIKFLLAALVSAGGLAIASSAGPDLLRGRIVERWQVEQSLGLPVLGEIRRDR